MNPLMHAAAPQLPIQHQQRNLEACPQPLCPRQMGHFMLMLSILKHQPARWGSHRFDEVQQAECSTCQLFALCLIISFWWCCFSPVRLVHLNCVQPLDRFDGLQPRWNKCEKLDSVGCLSLFSDSDVGFWCVLFCGLLVYYFFVLQRHLHAG